MPEENLKRCSRNELSGPWKGANMTETYPQGCLEGPLDSLKDSASAAFFAEGFC